MSNKSDEPCNDLSTEDGVSSIKNIEPEIKETNSSEATTNDPYAYLERDFSSENFKIEVKNMPKYYGVGEFRKLLNEKLKLNSNKIKTVGKNSSYAFVCFRNEIDRNKAIEVLSNYKWKGKQLRIVKAKPAPDPLVKKRQQEAEENVSNKKQKFDGRTRDEKLKDSVIPYWNIDYKQQLEFKQDHIKKLLRKFGNDLTKQNSNLQKWIEKQKLLHDGLPCELLNIRYSDQIEGYRNKCEFSVGINEETNLPTVGFRLGSYVNGVTGVGNIDNLPHIPHSMKVAVKLFEKYVRTSDLEVFNPELHKGYFRQLMVRSAQDQLMLVVGIHPQNLSEEKLQHFKQSLIDYFSKDEGKDAKVTSLYYQKIVKKNNNDDIILAEHLWGDTHIYETILGLKFRISPEAFFQVNSKGAEILYQSAIELAEVVEQSTVLDVCCGTGTIGLCFANKCNQVLGIEIIPQAVKDAVKNADINEIKNASFFEGKAEDILGDVCFRTVNSDVVAIVDPPRAGLQKKAVTQIRKIEKIRRVIYISCNPNAALTNFVDFGRPESKKIYGDILVPTRAIAVDMFPFTKHCELVVCFKRWKDVENSSVI